MSKRREIIERNEYTSRIQPFIGKQIIKVFTGQRRVGKSCLLQQIMNKISLTQPDTALVYINLEEYELSKIRTDEHLHQYITTHTSPDKKTALFIDEIQNVNGFEKVLRSILLNESFDIYVTGSNAKMLSSELATYLSGRYIEIPVYGLSYPEFIEFNNIADSDQSFEKYARFGGLPFLRHLPLEESIVTDYLKLVYSTILFHDITERYQIRNTLFLENLVKFLADNVGSLFSAKNISDYLKSQFSTLSVNQIQAYAGYLCNAFMLHNVKRYDLAGKRMFEVGEKYYFEDLGIRNVLVGYWSKDKGKILENLIFKHLKYLGYGIKVGNMNGQEIDFVAEKNNERIYIQAALAINDEETENREFGNLLKIKDNYPKYVVTWNGFEGNTYEGIEELSVRQFCSRKDF